MIWPWLAVWGICAFAPVIDEDIRLRDWAVWTLGWALVLAIAYGITAVIL